MIDDRVMADFVVLCKRKGSRKVPFVCLSLPEGGCFTRDFCQCDHALQNLMVSNNIKTCILGLIRLKLWEFVWLRLEKTIMQFQCINAYTYHYSGLCRLEG